MLEASLRALRLDHIDLWLVHWPPGGTAAPETWERFIAARESGKVRAIGVSNYDLTQIDELTTTTGVTPAVNQVPWNPPRHDPAALAAHRARGVVVEGYSPLNGTDLHSPTLPTIAHHHGVTPAQVVLRWHLEHNILVIPKSGDPHRMRANLDLWHLHLDTNDLAAIDGLATNL